MLRSSEITCQAFRLARGRIAACATAGVLSLSPVDVNSGSVASLREDVYPGTISLRVDVSDVEQGIYRVHERVPVKPGALTLLYPQWLPGNHAPRGRVDTLTGLTIAGAGTSI